MRSPEQIRRDLEYNVEAHKCGTLGDDEYQERRDDLIREYVTSCRNYVTHDATTAARKEE